VFGVARPATPIWSPPYSTLRSKPWRAGGIVEVIALDPSFRSTSIKNRVKIALVGCGGTIAMTRICGRALEPTLSASDLLRSIPEIEVIANVAPHDLMQLDSSDLWPEHWTRLAEHIDTHGSDSGAIVVTHGTDTLAYTAAALALAFGPGLGKPIVLTGAQRPPGHRYSDAHENLVDAVRAAVSAAEQRIAEVMISFRRRVLRGIRARKRSAVRVNAFASPSVPPLAEITDGPIRFRPHARRQNASAALRGGALRAAFADGVAHLCVSPGLTPESLRRWFATGTVRAVVLQAFGAGNIPGGDHDLSPVIREAIHDRGIPVVLASPYDGERTRAAYSRGLAAVRAGALPSGDRTPETIIVKLSWLLGHGLDEPEIRRRWPIDEVGEGKA
jgi:L-asparaginase